MSYLDDYNQAFHGFEPVDSDTPLTAYAKSHMQQFVNDRFTAMCDIYSVEHKDRITGEWSTVDVELYKPYNMKDKYDLQDDFFKIIFKNFDYIVYLGDYFRFQGYMWIVTDAGNINDMNASCIVQRCNVELKFTDSNLPVMPTVTQPIITIYGISNIKILDPEEDKYILLPRNQMNIKIPNDTNGRKIKDSTNATRFLIGNPYKSWKVIGVDTVTYVRKTFASNTPDDYNGLISLRLLSDSALNQSTDNIALGIAKQT